MGKIIGIDLGTTNSCVAVVEGGEPTVVPERGRQPDHVFRRGLREGRRASRRRYGQAAGGNQS